MHILSCVVTFSICNEGQFVILQCLTNARKWPQGAARFGGYWIMTCEVNDIYPQFIEIYVYN